MLTPKDFYVSRTTINE